MIDAKDLKNVAERATEEKRLDLIDKEAIKKFETELESLLTSYANEGLVEIPMDTVYEFCGCTFDDIKIDNINSIFETRREIDKRMTNNYHFGIKTRNKKKCFVWD